MSGFHGPEQSATLQNHVEVAAIEEMSDGEQKVLREKMLALDKLFGSKAVVARHKIEVQFGKERSTWKAFPGMISLYLSGTKLNGGGDEKLYMCPRNDCSGVIPPFKRFVKEVGGKAIAYIPCPKCGMMWPENSLVGEIFYRLTPKDWALVILRFFARLEHNADIYVKYHRTDIRAVTMMELARARGGETINKARNSRGLHIYPLKNVIKDTSAGAQLYDRILTFITS
jgi:hypothetical protein